jgi:hypothetical protein
MSDLSTCVATSTDTGFKNCPHDQPLLGVCVLSLHTIFGATKFLTLGIFLFFDAELSQLISPPKPPTHNLCNR